MAPPAFDAAQLHEYASAESIRRGREYFQDGAVGARVLRGDELEADVEGSAPRPYRVWIQFDAEGVANAACTCPYEYEGWCKHIVAVLLAYAQNPGQVEIRSPLAERLAGLGRAQLISLVLELVERVPRLVDLIEPTLKLLDLAPEALASGAASAATATVATAGASRGPLAPVDPHTFRQDARNLLCSRDSRWERDYNDDDDYDDYDGEYGGVVDDLVELAQQAQPYLDTGDSRSALAILEAVTDEFRQHGDILDETGEEPDTFFDGIAPPWFEALLDPDLTAGERQHWERKLASWQKDFDDSGSHFLAAARTVARQGWDDPNLCAILRGEPAPGGLWGDAPPPHARKIVLARLRVLERTGQDEAYLNLARAVHYYCLYALRLLELGRIEDAVAVGLEHVTLPGEALELAKALRERGAGAAALDVAERGLQQLSRAEDAGDAAPSTTFASDWCSQDRGELAAWLRDRAAEQGQIDRALAAGGIAFRELPSSAVYRQLEKLAGARWPELKPDLLDFLRRETGASAETKVEIFLREDLIDDAIQVIERSYVSSETLIRVMDAVASRRPEWVIAQARRQAEPIMNEGKSAYYEDAAMWLRKAKQAHEALGQKAEWRTYLGALREKHQRKYKLMPLLATL